MRYVALTLVLSASSAWAQPDAAPPPAAAGSAAGSTSAAGSAADSSAGAGSAAGPVAPAEAPTTGGPGTPGTGTGSAASTPVNPPAVIEHANADDRDRAHELDRERAQDLERRLDPDRGFRFGSYGRVIAGTDLRGGKPEKIAIVAHAPRIVEPSYLELETSYGFVTDHGVKIRPLVTLAFDGTLFHETGQFDAHPALRNMFVEAQVARADRVGRLADVPRRRHLPVRLLAARRHQHRRRRRAVSQGFGDRRDRRTRRPDAIELAAHGGENRLDVPFQFQQIDVANPVQGATTVVQLNRQRLIASLSAAYITSPAGLGIGLKAKVHAEVHELGSGTLKRDDGTLQKLPADSGMLIGAELGAFGFRSRQARLPPSPQPVRALRLGPRRVRRARAADHVRRRPQDEQGERAHVRALGQLGRRLGNMMLGALSRRFTDATGNTEDPNNGWEYAVDARPLAQVRARLVRGRRRLVPGALPARPEPDHAARRGSGACSRSRR